MAGSADKLKPDSNVTMARYMLEVGRSAFEDGSQNADAIGPDASCRSPRSGNDLRPQTYQRLHREQTLSQLTRALCCTSKSENANDCVRDGSNDA